MSLESIKPCPFCGGRPQLSVHCSGDQDDTNEGGSFIECMTCHASTPLVFGIKENPITRLLEIWNRRPPEDSDALAKAERTITWLKGEVTRLSDALRDQIRAKRKAQAELLDRDDRTLGERSKGFPS